MKRFVATLVSLILVNNMLFAGPPAKTKEKSTSEESKKTVGSSNKKEKDDLFLRVSFDDKKVGAAGYKTRTIEILMFSKGKNEKTYNVYMVEPGNSKEKPIGVVDMSKQINPGWKKKGENEWAKSQNITVVTNGNGVKMTGYEIIVKDKDGELVTKKPVW